MTKKLLLFALGVVLALTANAYDFRVGGLCYNIIGDGEVTVTYESTYTTPYYINLRGSVVIPESVEYNGTTYSVTSIGVAAFYGCTELTSVTIPNSVTYIDRDAFYGCTGLTSITIPNSVISIGNSAFSGTAWYDNQPNGLVYAGLVAYKYKGTKPSGTAISLKAGTKGIADYAFSGCSGLTSITIPNSVTKIGNEAFYYCSGLTSVTIPNSVTSISNLAFEGCSGLTSVTIGNSVTSIGYKAFSGCRGLTSVTIPNSVTEIGSSAFYKCTGLTSVTIPNSVTSIGGGAFERCSGLTSVTIPNSVTSIGGNAFNGTAWYNNQPNGLVYTGLVAYIYKGTMPSGTDISLKPGTKGIAGEAFSGCSGLTKVTIPNSVTSIGSYAFRSCTGLTSVTIPNSVTSIGGFAFSGCSGLTSVTIPNSVTSIGEYAFDGCSGLTSIGVESGNTIYDSRNNCNAIVETATNTLIAGCKNTIIPNSVTSIGNGAFRGCSGLTSVTIPNSVTSIGEYAFYRCSGLTSVTIPNSVTSIGYQAFWGCSGLKRMEAYPDPTKVTMGSNVFYGVPKAGTLHVLPRYYDAYQTRAPWSEFDPIIADLNESPAVVEDVDGNGTIDVGDINAVITAMLHGQTVCDITGDGIVDVSDVNRVITAALRQN